MDHKTFEITTDDDTWITKFARAGIIVRGPKLKFSFRFWRWMYWMKVKHMPNVTYAERNQK